MVVVVMMVEVEMMVEVVMMVVVVVLFHAEDQILAEQMFYH